MSIANGIPQLSCLDEILDFYLDELRGGRATGIDEFAKQYPSFSEEIQELLPALIFAEQLNQVSLKASPFEYPLVPEKLGSFTLICEIGRGSNGVVYKAIQDGSGRKVALKILICGANMPRSRHSKLKMDAEFATKLEHSHIVPVEAFGSDVGFDFLVMPMINGLSLDRFLSKSVRVQHPIVNVFETIRSDWRLICEMGENIAAALHYVHQFGVVHQDIKPANLLLDQQGKIWVTDFGFAKQRTGESSANCYGESVATPRYMAPELSLGIIDVRSDIYSLGLTLYEILAFPDLQRMRDTERQPHGVSFRDIVDLREINSAIPDSVAELVMKACNCHPANRFQTAQELKFNLNRVRRSA